jgi:excisionase family DNA binding protein
MENIERKFADLPDVLTVEEAAPLLRCGTKLVYEMIRAGELPAKRLGRRVVVPKARLVRWLEEGGGDAGGERGGER